MELLIILYFSIYLGLTTFRINSYPEKLSAFKLAIISSLYPLQILIFLLNIFLYFFGIHLQYNAAIIVSDEDYKDMTDKD